MKSFVPIEDISHALDHLCKFFPSKSALSRATGVADNTLQNWLCRGGPKKVKKENADKVLKLYEAYRDRTPSKKVLSQSIKNQKFEPIRPMSGGKLTTLEVGKRYSIKRKDMSVRGRVTKDFRRFYLVDCGKYKATVLKNDLCTKECTIVKL